MYRLITAMDIMYRDTLFSKNIQILINNKLFTF